MTYQYSWSPAGPKLSVDAQTVGEELERIRQRDGGVTVDAMLEAARPEDAPLHPLCEWDDQIAGEKWRRHQVRQIPRRLQVMMLDAPRPAYTHIHPSSADVAPYYQDTLVAVQNIDEYSLAFKHANQRVIQAQTAMADLERVADSEDSPQARDRRALLAQATQGLAVALQALRNAA